MLILKVGGGKQIRWDFICQDLKSQLETGEKILLVHGASEARDEIAQKMGSPTKTVVSPSGITSVYTDKVALDIFLMAYCGLVNKTIVATLQSYGINAVGLSGVDGKLWQAQAKPNLMIKDGNKTKLIKDNKTGRVEKINTELIELLINNGYVPVISSPAISFDSEIVNTDNDTATAVMAGALSAKKVIFLFEAPGLMKDLNVKNSLIGKIAREDLEDHMQFAKGRMKKKLMGAKKALDLGVEFVYFGDGRVENPITNVLSGQGTIINLN